MGTPSDAVVCLIDPFSRDRQVFLSPDYKEEQLRAEFRLSSSIRHSSFVIPTFRSKPVIHEESIKVAGATKAPDYTFRIGGDRRPVPMGRVHSNRCLLTGSRLRRAGRFS